jgi:hypothetical protein
MSCRADHPKTFEAINPGRRLVIPVTPKKGEGLPELFHRAASENSYTSSRTVMVIAGLPGVFPAGIATTALGHEQAIASTLGVEGGPETIRKLVYEPIEGKPGWHRFFGTQMRNCHREVSRRRVSPLALRRSNYARAIWSIKIFSFDPETKETLLDKCPICGTWLRHGVSYGVSCCSKCLGEDAEGFVRSRVDFRDFPQPVIEVEDLEALDFVTGLVDPNPDVRSAFNPALPESLRGFSREALFEFAIALACVVSAEPAQGGAYVPRASTRHEFSSRFKPEILALAGRTMLSWPSGFEKLASLARTQSKLRSGHYGIKKELGALLSLRIDPHIDPGLREEARRVIEHDMRETSTGAAMVRRREHQFDSDLITIQQAEKRHQVNRRVVRRLVSDGVLPCQRVRTSQGPVLISNRELTLAIEARKKWLPAASVSKRLCLPKIILKSLADTGFFVARSNPPGMTPGLYFDKDTVKGFLDRVEQRSKKGPPFGKRGDLCKTGMVAGSPFANPWPALFSAILEGSVELFVEDAGLPFANRYALKPEDVTTIAALPWDADDQRPALTRNDVGFFLGVSVLSVYGLIGDKILTERPSLEEVQRFKAEFIMGAEAAELLTAGVSQLADCGVHNLLTATGISPVYTTSYQKRRVWRRSDLAHLAQDTSLKSAA